MVSTAAKVLYLVANYTLYQKPLLTPGEALLLAQNTWDRAQSANRYVEKVKEVENYVG